MLGLLLGLLIGGLVLFCLFWFVCYVVLVRVGWWVLWLVGEGKGKVWYARWKCECGCRYGWDGIGREGVWHCICAYTSRWLELWVYGCVMAWHGELKGNLFALDWIG